LRAPLVLFSDDAVSDDVVAEGVIQFAARHVDASLDDEFAGVGAELIGWRNVLFAVGFIGLDPQRYDGVGFGNALPVGDPRTFADGHRRAARVRLS
jgi:hypothetical protein